jgi:hypothetical protein
VARKSGPTPKELAAQLERLIERARGETVEVPLPLARAIVAAAKRRGRKPLSPEAVLAFAQVISVARARKAEATIHPKALKGKARDRVIKETQAQLLKIGRAVSAATIARWLESDSEPWAEWLTRPPR